MEAEFVIQMATVYHNLNAVILDAHSTERVRGHSLREVKVSHLANF